MAGREQDQYDPNKELPEREQRRDRPEETPDKGVGNTGQVI